MSLGLVGRASSGWRRVFRIADQGVIGIGGQGVVWVALCHWDWWAGRRVGGAVSLGLVGRASCGWRCVIAIDGEGVVWVALCHWDWWAGRRVGGAVSLRLMGKASCGWRCVIGIAGQGVVWVALYRSGAGTGSRGVSTG